MHCWEAPHDVASLQLYLLALLRLAASSQHTAVSARAILQTPHPDSSQCTYALPNLGAAHKGVGRMYNMR